MDAIQDRNVAIAQMQTAMVFAERLVPCCELFDLAATWKKHATKAREMTAHLCERNDTAIALESCAMDLHRLADSWTERHPTPNVPDEPQARSTPKI